MKILDLKITLSLRQHSKFMINYIFSLIGLVGYIVFETITLASLSEGYVFNTFGMETRYSNPECLKNIF